MQETTQNNLTQEAEKGGYLKNKKVALWGCLLVGLMVLAFFIIVFVFGQYAAIPGNDGVGP